MPQVQGNVKVITGSMFSGKTEELQRLVRHARIAKQKVQVFKPKIDNRYSAAHVASHNGITLEAIAVTSSQELFLCVEEDTQVIAVDEAQFFDEGLVQVVETLANMRKRVIVAGLNLNFRGEPFGPMHDLMVYADHVVTLHAICNVCGEKASRTQRIIDGKPAKYHDPVIMIGASESYEARCREHHEVPGKH